MPLALYSIGSRQRETGKASIKITDFHEADSIFIDDDTELEARYGAQVPVLRDTERSIELAWPFDARRIAMFLAS